MAKNKISYLCGDCGHNLIKWMGSCPQCQSSDIVEFKEQSSRKKRTSGYAGSTSAEVLNINDINNNGDSEIRIDTGSEELNRVFGGGAVEGSVSLLIGPPGIGKSTILISVSNTISQNTETMYVTGEESLGQVVSRGKRLDLDMKKIKFMSETDIDTVLDKVKLNNIKVCIIDSIQTMESEDSSSEAGSTSQLKICTKKITRFAKQNNITFLIIGHITKDGSMAGPKQLEHIIDCSLMIEGESSSRYRILRANKNRYGTVNEIGVFAMTEKGMKDVKNPSELFLSSSGEEGIFGTAITVSRDGTRPLLFEVQSLVAEMDENQGYSQQIVYGFPHKKLSMIIAVLNKYTNQKIYGDIYMSTVGGIEIPASETGAHVSIALSLLSSNSKKTIPKGVCSFGEIGLTGEIRAVQNVEERIMEADKHEFSTIIIPHRNYNKTIASKLKNSKLVPIKNIKELVDVFENLQ